MAANGAGMRSIPPGMNRACVTDWIEDNPSTSMTVLFGIGTAVGLLVGHTLAESAGRKMFHEDTLTEKLTGRFRDVLKSHFPHNVARHFT